MAFATTFPALPQAFLATCLHVGSKTIVAFNLALSHGHNITAVHVIQLQTVITDDV
jgi:hypothetical protein